MDKINMDSQEVISGFVSIVGRPNAGKSTLLNYLAGEKVAIVTHKAQTTRHNIKAIWNDDDSQIVFTDTPGLHTSTNRLGEYMLDSAWKALAGADVVLLIVDSTWKKITSLETECLKKCIKQNKPIILLINKVDTIPKENILPLIERYSNLEEGKFTKIIPVSAKNGSGLPDMLQAIKSFLPMGPRFYDVESFTDQSERKIVAEMIREQLLIYTHEEVPHGTGVIIENFEEKANPGEDRHLIVIHAAILCDKDTHKGIIIGKKGQNLKRIGSSARIGIEKLLDCKVFLDIHVKVRSDWRNRSGILNDMGYKKYGNN